MSSKIATFNKPADWVDATEQDVEVVSRLIGKTPQGEFRVVVRNDAGEPVVIENSPFFFDGTPMPTRYWLVDPELVADVSRIESSGGVKKVQKEISLEEISAIHQKHNLERNYLIPENYDGPKPTGGVGGTRQGIKCLHTHVANLLASGDDLVGQWTLNEIEKMKLETK